MAARKKRSRPPMRAPVAYSWVPIDTNYVNRRGFDPKFLGDVPVGLPKADGTTLKAEDLLPALHYQHFSVRMHRQRNLAAFTAVNISGAERYQRTGREEDSWEEDPRAPGIQTTQPAYRSPFQRGHLVMRLDPVWGRKDIAERAEADTFHWTNCAPQHRKLNNPWWLSVERHVLETALVRRQRVSVFSGPVFSPQDPLLRGVRVPLAYWKVVVWRVPDLKVGLRSLGFLVRQDAEVWAAVAAAAGPAGVPHAPRPVRGFEDTPTRVQGYQVPVRTIEELTGLRFGRVAGSSVDVLARRRTGGLRSPVAGKTTPGMRTLGSVADLVVE
jgi:endonuclease G